MERDVCFSFCKLPPIRDDSILYENKNKTLFTFSADIPRFPYSADIPRFPFSADIPRFPFSADIPRFPYN